MFKVKILDNFCRSNSDITGLDNLKSHTVIMIPIMILILLGTTVNMKINGPS